MGDVKTDAKDKVVLIDTSKDNPGVGDEPIDISSSTQYGSPPSRVCQGRWWPHTNAYWAGVAAFQKLAHQRLIEKTTAIDDKGDSQIEPN